MAGRGKKKPVSEKEFKKAEEYAFAGCKNNTICKLMGWDHNLIEQRADIKKRLEKKRAERDIWLRNQQNRIAGSNLPQATTMTIFLGKNELGQSDKQDIKHTGAVGTREISEAELRELMRDEPIPCEDAIAR